jgi:hypothetical protein
MHVERLNEDIETYLLLLLKKPNELLSEFTLSILKEYIPRNHYISSKLHVERFGLNALKTKSIHPIKIHDFIEIYLT